MGECRRVAMSRADQFVAVEVAGTGHFVMMEKPVEFNKLLSDFLPKANF